MHFIDFICHFNGIVVSLGNQIKTTFINY